MSSNSSANRVPFGNGFGWLLADTNVTVQDGQLPEGFSRHQGHKRVIDEWRGGAFESGILWVHQTDSSSILAIPTARWDGYGIFKFFLSHRAGRVIELPAWSGHCDWSKSAEQFHAAREVALSIGNSTLGITPIPVPKPAR